MRKFDLARRAETTRAPMPIAPTPAPCPAALPYASPSFSLACRTPLAINPRHAVPIYLRWEEHLTSVRNVSFVQVGANCGANTRECAVGGEVNNVCL